MPFIFLFGIRNQCTTRHAQLRRHLPDRPPGELRNQPPHASGVFKNGRGFLLMTRLGWRAFSTGVLAFQTGQIIFQTPG
jgi:hypothetical protein